MPNGSPPARRRPSGGAPSADRPRPRRPTSAAVRAAPVAKLVCTAGPRAGEEFPLTDGEVVVGRATDATISIPDTSVSRKHVLLQKVADGWAASDMGSGNGTLVNGEPIAEETVLRNGDIITIGDTELSFVEVDAGTDRRSLPVRRSPDLPVRPSSSRIPVRSSRSVRMQAAVDPEAQKKRKKILLFGGVALAVVVTSLIGIKVWQRVQENQRLAIEVQAQKLRAQLGAIFQEGKNLVREGKWAEAKVKFEEIAAVNPSYPTLQDYLDRANKEIPNQEHLAKAAKALENNQLGPAKAALDQVTQDTTQYQQLRQLKLQLDEKLNTRLGEARLLLDNGGTKDLTKMRQLAEMTDDMLAAFPDNRDALELNKQAKASIEELTRPPPERPRETPKPWLDVQDRFKAGDVSGAFALANDCAAKKIPQCKSLKEKIAAFQADYPKLESLPAAKLEKLLDLDEEISGAGGSKMAGQIGTRLASSLYKSASSAKAAGEWGRAMDYAKRTLRADPGHAGAQAMVKELRGKAKDLYLQAYQIEAVGENEQAIRMYKDVLAMTPKDDEYHQKARNRLDKLEKQ